MSLLFATCHIVDTFFVAILCLERTLESISTYVKAATISVACSEHFIWQRLLLTSAFRHNWPESSLSLCLMKSVFLFWIPSFSLCLAPGFCLAEAAGHTKLNCISQLLLKPHQTSHFLRCQNDLTHWNSIMLVRFLDNGEKCINKKIILFSYCGVLFVVEWRCYITAALYELWEQMLRCQDVDNEHCSSKPIWTSVERGFWDFCHCESPWLQELFSP